MDLYLLGPELSVIGLAVAVIILDLFVGRKEILAAVSVAGLAVPMVWTLSLLGYEGTAFNGMLVVDSFSVFFKVLFIAVAALVILASVEYASRFSFYKGEYYALVLFATVGMMLMASTRELISLYIALELASISLYVLAAFLKNATSGEAGIKYMLLGALSSAILLYGMALLFGATGTTDLGEIARATIQSRGTTAPALLLGTIFLVGGFGFKIAAVPFQMWAPDVYEGAPTPVTAFLSAGSKAAGFAVVLRVFFTALGNAGIDWPILFAVLSAITMSVGNIAAIPQTNIKRMLAYSSIAHAGYVMIGLATISQIGVSGTVFLLLAYVAASLGAFITIIAISNRTNSDNIADYAGIARRSPLLALGMTICLASLIGIPPTAGFVGKIYLFWEAVRQGLLWLVVFGVVNSVISAYYYLRVVRTMYLGAPTTEERLFPSRPLVAALATALVGVMVMGVYPSPFLIAVQQAVRVLFP
ncbi:MAG: NADH-quinone oxidoreductase subunit N [Chloroflexi bacterium]|nr:NADH-quinone oxidoreductase subunit N [Chloroflexota bacterium]